MQLESDSIQNAEKRDQRNFHYEIRNLGEKKHIYYYKNNLKYLVSKDLMSY